MSTRFNKGDIIGGKYEVRDVLGEGGFGIVYLVYYHKAEIQLALKTFKDEYLNNIQIRQRFYKEAKTWVALGQHPYIVQALLVENIAGRLYIAMEYISGDEAHTDSGIHRMNNLDAFIKHRPPDLPQIIIWAIQFCYGMAYAFSKGLRAHRDIKPANILIDTRSKWTIKITDFGLAGAIPQMEPLNCSNKHIGDNKFAQTSIGLSIGTPEYMSPEQFDSITSCDERSDIYSFGIVLYEMASYGKLPFYADNPDYKWQALMHLHQESALPKLDSPLHPIIRRCLEKKPSNRYQSFNEMGEELELMLKHLTGNTVKPPDFQLDSENDLILRSNSLMALGQYEEALACCDKVLTINSGSLDALLNKSSILQILKRYEEAFAYADKALIINSRFAQAWVCRGAALRPLKRYDEAIDSYKRALDLDPYNKESWSNMGTTYNFIGNHINAISCFDHALEIDDKQPHVWTGKAVSLSALTQHEDAIICLDNALKIHPLDARVWYSKGTTLYMIKKYSEAIGCFDKSLEIDPGDGNTWANRGAVLAALGEYENAIDSYNKALEIDRSDAFAWYNKGNSLIYLDKADEAIICYDKALEINPVNSSAWNGKGKSLSNLDKHEEAIVCYEKAIEIDSRNANAWYNRGLSLVSLDKPQEAIISLDKSIEIDPTNAPAWIAKGIAEEKLNRIEAAIASYKHLLGLSSGCDPALIAHARERLDELSKMTTKQETAFSDNKINNINQNDAPNKIEENIFARPHHYLFSHKIIPYMLFENSLQLIACLTVTGESYLTAIWDELPNSFTEIQERLPNTGLDCKIIENDKNVTIYIISLPKPIKITEAYYAAIIYRPEKSEPFKQEGITRYLTLELTVGDCNDAVLCEWTVDGNHNNYGKMVQPTLGNFVQAIFEVIAKDYCNDQEAIACYDKTIEIDSTDAIAWYNKGNELNSLGKQEEALSCFDKALGINPNYAEAWNNKGLALGKLGRYQEALDCYDKASKIKS